MILGFLARAVPALRSPFFYDEYKAARLVDRTSLDPSSLHIPLHGDRHPPGQIYWAYLTTKVIGHNLLGYRAPALIAGTLSILLAFLLGRGLAGDAGGLTAAALTAANEYLIGTSRIATELSAFLFLTLLALLLFEKAVARPTKLRFVALGLVFGLATLTKESAVLWAVPLAVLLIRRAGGWRFLRRPHAWLATLVFLLVVSPAIVWSLMATPDPADPSAAGLAYQAGRLTIGHWSWGALALYLRPLRYYFAPHEISEYASMTTLPGIVILAGAVTSLFILQGERARLLQALGFGSFFFVALCTAPNGEFWWADLSIFPFLLLTAAVLIRVPRRAVVLNLAVAVIMTTAAFRLAATSDNYHRLDIGAPDPGAVAQLHEFLAFSFTAFPERDHLSLYRVGRWAAPPLRAYERQLLEYRDYLGSRNGTVAADPVDAFWSVDAATARFWTARIERDLERIRHLQNVRDGGA